MLEFNQSNQSRDYFQLLLLVNSCAEPNSALRELLQDRVLVSNYLTFDHVDVRKRN